MNYVLVVFMFLASPVAAQSLGERTGVNALIDQPPSATDVLLEIHQFDLFQQQVDESADKRGDESIKKLSKTQAAAAEKRGDALLGIQKKVGLEFKFPEDVSSARDNQLAGLSGSVAEVFVRNFYDVQRTEYNSVLSTLKRYLAKPDNNDVKVFVETQARQFEAGLRTIEAAQTHGPPVSSKNIIKAK